jgi:hypothetical protein
MNPVGLSRGLWLLVGVYAFASLLHFAHNAEYIAHYPNMPAWLTRGDVYLVWLANTSFGLLALACLRLGWRLPGLLLLAGYGALGLDGLGHYALALCSQHTLAMNATIGFEVMTGVALAGLAMRQATRGAPAHRARA